MNGAAAFFRNSALGLRAFLAARDARLLVLCVAALSLTAWLAPWPVLLCLLLPACALACAAVQLMPRGRAVLAAYGFFILIWAGSRFCLYLLEHPGAFSPALAGAALLGCRLFTLLGLALAVPLVVTPLTLGRVLAWILSGPARLEAAACSGPLRGKVRPRLTELAWRAGLALALMMAFFPRAFETLSGLRRTLRLRAPHLPLHRRLALLALAALRILSSQTWDMALAVASRDLYRPGPWQWR